MAMPQGLELIDSVDWFLGSFLPEEKYLKSRFEGIAKARKLLAHHDLTPKEMLQWVPALSMGGSREESGLEIVPMREGHQLLSQAGELRLLRY
jgi:hypothetical protein